MVEHGTESGYTGGCRCDDCRTAARKARARRRAGITIRKQTWRHGTAYGYSRRGCRCEPCTEAHRLEKRSYRERRRERESLTSTASDV